MNSEIDEFLDLVDQWKSNVQERLKQLTPKQRAAFWSRIGRRAGAMGLRVIDSPKPTKRPHKPVRRTA